MNFENLGNHIEQIRGITYKKEQSISTSQKGYVPILRAGNIGNAQEFNFDDLIYVPSKLINNKQFLKKGDILISTSSGSINIIGKSAKLKSNLDYSFGAFCKVIRCKTSVNPDYLALFFRTDYYRRTISNLARGANINNLKREHIDNLKILSPSLETQKVIAETLNQLETIINKRKQSISLLDNILKSFYLSKFCKYFLDEKLQITLEKVMLSGPQNGLYKHERQYGKGTRILVIDKKKDKSPIIYYQVEDSEKVIVNRKKYSYEEEYLDVYDKILPAKIIAYSSGGNEQISKPFLRMGFFYFDEFERASVMLITN
jgi:type I restriction enzyme S subunit